MGTDFQQTFGEQPSQCGLTPASDLGLSTASPPEAPAGTHPPVGADSLSRWQRERVTALDKIFRCAEWNKSNAAWPIRRTLMVHATRNRGRFYRSKPDRPIRFTFPTLRRLWYVWMAAGRKAEALAIRHRPGSRSVCSAEAERFFRVCLDSTAGSIRAAYVMLSAPSGTADQYRYALGRERRELLSQLFAARRLISRLEGQAQKAAFGLGESANTTTIRPGRGRENASRGGPGAKNCRGSGQISEMVGTGPALDTGS